MITIDEINKSIGLSTRSFKVCHLNDLTNLDALLNYYQEKGDFLDLTNCGIKSNLELKMLCERLMTKIKNEGTESLKDRTDPDLELAYESISKADKKKVNQKLKYEISKLSLRTRNSIFRFFDGEINMDKFYSEIISDPYFDPMSMEGVGRRSEEEISQLIRKMSTLILEKRK